MAIKLKYSKFIKWLVSDKDQVEFIRDNLVEHRNGDLKTYIKRGIFYSRDIGEIEYICDQLGITLEEFGVTEENESLFENGFIIPVLDSRNRVMFYINYDYRRDKSKKYMNAYHNENGGKEKELKLFGLHNVKQAMREDRIFVVEGVFDVLRLEQHGLPVVAGLGTKVMDYHKYFYKRFKRVIYIPDGDTSGESAWRKFKREVPHAEVLWLPVNYGDVDEFGAKGKENFTEWVTMLKEYRKKRGTIKN